MSDPLFDAPGPRGRLRIRIATIVSLLALTGLGAWAVWLFASNGQLEADRWVEFTQWPYIRFLLDGLWATLWCTLVASLISFPLALALALGRLSRRRWVSVPVGMWVEVFRTIPLLLMIYVFIGWLPSLGFNPPVLWKLVLPIVLCASPVIAEVFRAGILALPKGQSEAAAALGLSPAQAQRHVILPQAFRLMMPSLITQVVNLLKDSTLGYAASFAELMHQGQVLAAFTGNLIQTYLVIGGIYIVINLALSQFASWLDRRTTRRFVTGNPRLAPGTTVHSPTDSPAVQPYV